MVKTPKCKNALLPLASALAILCFATEALRGEPSEAAGNASAEGSVFILPLQGPIDKSMLFIFRRAFAQVEKQRPAAVVIDMDTPGGGLVQTEEIINWIRSLDIPVFSYVNPRGLSAGAIISLGCDRIFMAPGSRIGSAMPIAMTPTGGVQELPEDVAEKLRSDVRAMVRGLAQENGYWEDLAEAMVDPERSVTVGGRTISQEGELLNLTAEDAIEIIPPREDPVLATAIVDDIDALLAHVGLDGSSTLRFEATPSEKIARYLTMIGPLLLALGLLGVYIEFKTPGFGIPGLLGAIFLALFFFGHFIAGLAGVEDIFLVVLGIGLLALEIFVIPGFGIPGVLGILFIMAGIVLSLLPVIPDNPSPIPNFEPSLVGEYMQIALYRFVAAAGLTWVGAWLIGKLLPKTPLYGQLIHTTALATGEGRSPTESESRAHLVGLTGTAMTPLHPSGTARVDGERYDVVTSGDMVDKGTPIRVTMISGNRIVVEPAPETQDTPPAG